MSEVIRIFCACAPDGLDAESQAVVEYSIKKFASRPVEITWMRLSRDKSSPFYSDGPNRGWNTGNWATPFSWFRWAIPELCGFKGRGIYCDSDTQFFDDVAKLHDAPMPRGKVVMSKATNRLCVSMWDCAAAKRFSRPIAEMQRMGPQRGWVQEAWQPFPAGENWNCLDGEGLPLTDPSIKCIHFTDIATQPQAPISIARLKREGRKHWFEGELVPHPRPDLVNLWNDALDAAVKEGYTVDRYDQDPRYGKILKRDLTVYRGGPRQAVNA